jgi:hypothetical protein
LSFRLPFNYLNFEQNDILDGVDSLQKANVIRPIMDFMGEIRYAIVDDKLRKLIDNLYCIHLRQLNLMEQKWSYEKPTNDERIYMEFIYGKKEADKIINDAHFRRKRRNGYKNLFPSKQKQVNSYNVKMKEINEHIRKQKNEYNNVLLDCGMNQEFVESLILEKL